MRRISAVWARTDTCVEVLARTGAVLPGLSTELQALLTEVQAGFQAGRYTLLDVEDLGALWEYVERTGPRGAQPGWIYST